MRYKLYMVYALLGLALVQYQNCAPAGDVVPEAEGEAPVDVIDQVQVGSISFPQSKVAAYSDEQVTVIGVCDQSGSLISWKLENNNGELVERGLAECELGAFEVALSSSWQNHCDETLILKAALGADAASETEVEAFCN